MTTTSNQLHYSFNKEAPHETACPNSHPCSLRMACRSHCRVYLLHLAEMERCMTQSYDQIRTRWAVAEPFIGAATKGHTPIFDGQVHRAIIAHLLENGSATDHEIYPACKTTLLYTRKTLKEMLAAGLVQYADPSKKQRKPYGLTREGIRLALSQEIN